MESTQVPETPKKRSGLLFLEIGLLEVSFVIVGLLLFLGVLNYFNILSVSKALPFLSFLPAQVDKTVPAITISQPTKAPINPKTEMEKKMKIDEIYLKSNGSSSASKEPTPASTELDNNN